MVFYLIQGWLLALSATLMPGPFQTFLLSRSLQLGWKRTLPAALAPLVTDGPVIALVLALLTQLPPLFLDGLKIAGGLLILYIAGGMIGSLKKDPSVSGANGNAARKSFIQAVAMNALNPNPYLFWSVVGGPILLSGWRQSPIWGVAFLLGFYATFVISLAALIIVFAATGKIHQKANRILRAIAAVALMGFGVYQIASGVHTLL